jgi:transportin-3
MSSSSSPPSALLLPPHSSNVEEELQRVQLALDAVFAPQEHHQPAEQWFVNRQLADQYLTSFQGQPVVSWMVCDRLLQNGTEQQCFFAAQTLHTKCRAHVHELPPSSLPSLRDSLLAHAQRCLAIPNASSALLTRLALAVAALAVQMQWNTVIQDLLQQHQQQLQQQQPDNHQQQHHIQQRLLLVLLAVLPEECASDRLLLSEEGLRFQMRDHLVASAANVFAFLQSQWNQQQQQQSLTTNNNTTTTTRVKILQTFLSWIKYVPVQPFALIDCSLLQACIQTLQQQQQQQHAISDGDVTEAAADCIIEVLHMYPSHVPENQGLVQWMLPRLVQLQLPPVPSSSTSLSASRPTGSSQHNNSDDNDANNTDDDDDDDTKEDLLRAHTRIVTEMGESYLSLLLSPQHHIDMSLCLVEQILQASAMTCNTDIASITLHFWYRMITELEHLEPYEWRQHVVNIYEPQILRLLHVCVTSLIKYPIDIDDIPQDLVEDLHRHRYYVTETVEDLCRLLGGQIVLQHMGELFRQEIHRVSSNTLNTQQQQQDDWHGIEACLACIGAVHKFVPSDEAELLPQCFQLIPQLRQDIKPLRFTTSKMIGKFASWLAMHPDLLQPLLPFLASGLDIPECAPAAAVAIKELCQCSNQNFVIAEPVMHLYQDMVDSNKQRRLELQDELQILEGLCRALSRQVMDTRSNGADLLTRLVNPIGGRLSTAVNQPNSSPRRILPELDRLTTIVQHFTLVPAVNATHPVIDLMSSTWTLLDGATNRFPNDNMLAEKICRLHKHALRAVGVNQYLPVLDALMKQLVSSYERTRQSPYLYMASVAVVEYGQNPAYAQQLFDMVGTMATTTFSGMQNLQDMTNQPDVVEELFYLMGRVVAYCPDRFMTSPLLLSLFQCAVVAMQLDHYGANKGTLNFLDKSLSYGLSLRERDEPNCRAALENVLTAQGQAIVNNLARALMGDLPSYSNQIPELLWKLNLLCPTLLAKWLAAAFDSTPLPERAKNDFMGALDTGLARDEFNLAASAFQSACARERRFLNPRRVR